MYIPIYSVYLVTYYNVVFSTYRLSIAFIISKCAKLRLKHSQLIKSETSAIEAHTDIRRSVYFYTYTCSAHTYMHTYILIHHSKIIYILCCTVIYESVAVFTFVSNIVD